MDAAVQPCWRFCGGRPTSSGLAAVGREFSTGAYASEWERLAALAPDSAVVARGDSEWALTGEKGRHRKDGSRRPVKPLAPFHRLPPT